MAVGLPSYKVILVGEYGVGKSSIFRRYVDDTFVEGSGPAVSLGLDHHAKTFTFGADKIEVELWDTAGIERFATLSSSYFSSAQAAILCFALDSRESFGLLSQHLLDTAMNCARGARIFVCGNKLDRLPASAGGTPEESGVEDGGGGAPRADASRCVSEQELNDFCNSCGQAVAGSYRVSARTGSGVAEMLDHVASVLYSTAYHRFDPSRVKITEHQPIATAETKKCC